MLATAQHRQTPVSRCPKHCPDPACWACLCSFGLQQALHRPMQQYRLPASQHRRRCYSLPQVSFYQPAGFSLAFFLPSTQEKRRHRCLWKGSQPNWKKAGARCDNQHKDTLPKCISPKIHTAVMYFSISFSRLCKSNTKEKQANQSGCCQESTLFSRDSNAPVNWLCISEGFSMHLDH